MIYQGKARYPVRGVVLHTAAAPAGWHERFKDVNEMVEEINRWHLARGWRGIGYHRVVAPDGSIGIGRSLWEIGAHVVEANRGTVGICMINVNPHGKEGITRFENYFTEDQRRSVYAYINGKDGLRDYTDIDWVKGHNHWAPKACPGFRVKSENWLK